VFGKTDLTASQTCARDSLASGIREQLQTIPQRYASAGIFHGHVEPELNRLKLGNINGALISSSSPVAMPNLKLRV
jgi:hypothetical protein